MNVLKLAKLGKVGTAGTLGGIFAGPLGLFVSVGTGILIDVAVDVVTKKLKEKTENK